MTTIDVNAQLLVDDGSGTRVLSVNDLGVSETGGASETTLAALQEASHADLVDIVTALATILAKLNAPAVISDPTYNTDGNLTAWTQDGVDYAATYDADGNLLTQGPA